MRRRDDACQPISNSTRGDVVRYERRTLLKDIDMWTKLSIIAFLLATTTFAAAAPQDHHCKLPSGSYDAKKASQKQCTDAKGTWTKDASFTGRFETGVARIDTGTQYEIVIDDKTSYEVDLHDDPDMVPAGDKLNGKRVTITGYVETRPGVEVKERPVLVATTLVAAK